MKKVIFFDRDGTLIVDKDYLNDPNLIEYIPGVFEALRELKSKGFEFVLVTNQSGLATGQVEEKNHKQIHKKVNERFQLEGVPFLMFLEAPYLNTSNHYYRKPRPGMLNEAILRLDINRNKSWMVGDKLSDVKAGLAAGVKAVLFRSNEDIKEPYDPTIKRCRLFKDLVQIITNSSAF